MAQFLLQIQNNGSSIAINDLGITITGDAGDTYDLTGEQPNDVADSADLINAIVGGQLLVLDPRDGTTVLSVADSQQVILNHNTPHFGIIGGRFGALDDPSVAPPSGDTYLKYNASTDSYEEATAQDIVSDGDAVNEQQDNIESTLIDGNDVTFVVDAGTGNGDKTITINVDDSFLRNTGDNLESGTLTVDSGAAIAIASGASLTIADLPQNPTDAVNKAYADSLGAGLDPKESVRVATTADLSATYSAVGGSAGTGAFTGVPLAIDSINLVDGDRVLVKDQIDPLQNGIYLVTSAAGQTWERADDQDGDPVENVSSGNFTFVEEGSTLANTGWVLSGSGILTLNTDALNWVQFSAAGAYTAGAGLTLVGNEFRLLVNNLTNASAALGDELAFNDIDDSNTTKKRSFAQIFTDLDVPNGITGNGFAVQTASGTWTNREITIEGAGALDGLSLTNGDGIAGNPTIGLDIQNLPALSDAVDENNDLVPVYNATSGANEYYTVAQLTGSVTGTDSFKTWAAAGNTTGDISIIAGSASDTANLAGGAGVNIDFNDTTKTVTYSLSIAGLTNTAVAGGDTIPFFDADNSDAPEYRSFTNILEDLDIVNNLGGNGFAVQTSADTYAARSFTVSSTAGEEGLAITNGDGVAGNPELALDISGLTLNAGNMDTSDLFAINNGANNVALTGQEVADGTAAILGLGGLTVSTINTQSVLTLEDTVRSKTLSVDTVEIMYGENRLGNNEWMDIGNAVDADSSYIAPMDGTIVYATGHCEDTNSATMEMRVYINGVDTAAVGTLTGGDNAIFDDNTLSIDFAKGDRIRIRTNLTAGNGRIDDTVVSLFLKWRA